MEKHLDDLDPGRHSRSEVKLSLLTSIRAIAGKPELQPAREATEPGRLKVRSGPSPEAAEQTLPQRIIEQQYPL